MIPDCSHSRKMLIWDISLLFARETMRVLVAEDTDDCRELIKLTLEILGHQVIEARDGREAVQVAVTTKPDFILMDLSMPNVDGIQATRALRTIAEFRDTAIIAYSAHANDHWRKLAIEAGCNDCVSKSITPEELACVLESNI
jgi:two-component system, cell cycle response regulator DivK